MLQRVPWLEVVFAENESRPFLCWHDLPYTYGWLRRAVPDCMEVLASRGIRAGNTVALESDYSPLAIAYMLALVEAGCVTALLNPAERFQHERLLDIAEIEYVLQLSEGDKCEIRTRSVNRTNPLLVNIAARGDPGWILFSSGSSGKPKAILHSAVLLLERFADRKPSRLITIPFLLLDHIGGLNTLMAVLSSGGAAVVPESRRPESVCTAIEKHRVELLPASPTFLNLLVLSGIYKQYDLSSLRKITYGTEVMPQPLLKRLHEIFPNVIFQQTYGLSEVGILHSKSEAPDSLFMKVGGAGFEVKIKDGALWVKARSAMLGYLNAPSPFDAEGWLNTGDVVETNGEFLRILGRRSEIINVGGQKVYPVEVEEVLMTLDNVVDVSVFGEPHPLLGQIVCARFNLAEPEEAAQFRRKVREFCAGKLASYKTPVKIVVAESEQHTQRFKKTRAPAAGN